MSCSNSRSPRQTPSSPASRVIPAADSADATTYLVAVLGVRRPIRVSGDRDAKVAVIANCQRGRISRRQMRLAGLSDDTIDRLAATGHLHRRHRGVFTVGHTAPTPLGEETAALLACGEGAMLSHHTAALLWRLIPHGDRAIHVTTGGRHGPCPHGVRSHRSSSLAEADVRIHHGLPVTSPGRTLLDLAGVAELPLVERAVEEAITQRLVSEAELRARASAASGHRGAPRITAILDAQREPGITKSKAERRFRRLLRAAQLPDPLTNVRLHGYSVDCYWPDLGVVIEVQGYRFHSGRRAFERDTRKAARLTAAGLNVSYVTWLQMDAEPFAVVARVAQTLARHPHPAHAHAAHGP